MHPTDASGADYRAKPLLVKAGICLAALGAAAQILPWQCLNFLPEPHGQGALRPVPAQGERGRNFEWTAGRWGSTEPTLSPI